MSELRQALFQELMTFWNNYDGVVGTEDVYLDAILDAVIAALPKEYTSDLYREHPVDIIRAYQSKIIKILESAKESN